jgi:hypothetical protein
MGVAVPDFKAFAETVLRYDRVTVKAGTNVMMSCDYLAVLNFRAVKSATVST